MLGRNQNLVTYYRQSGTFNINDVLLSHGCVLWLKADAKVYNAIGDVPATDGQSVRKWGNSGLDEDFAFQNTEANRPIYHTNSLNSLPIISFTGDNIHVLVCQSTTNYNIYTPSIFLVGRYISGAGSFCGKGDGSDITTKHRKLQVIPQSNNFISFRAGTDAMSANAASVPDILDWNIYCIISHRDNLVYYNVSGVESWNTQVINNSNFNDSLFGLGASFPEIGTEPGTVDLAEIIILNHIAPKWKRDGIMDYLSDKWGIAI